jgi:tRNA(adenine34) deaminase
LSERARDEAWMRLALDQAHNAWLAGEVPVGAVIVRRGQLIATGYNRPITTHDPTAHAEVVALRHAATLAANYRLPECELFVTPGALRHVRHGADARALLTRVVLRPRTDPKTGAAGSVARPVRSSRCSTTTPADRRRRAGRQCQQPVA